VEDCLGVTGLRWADDVVTGQCDGRLHD
jgi:hypothetical protein